MYKCGKCGQEIDELPKGVIRCPGCAYRILFRMRDPLAKKMKVV